MNHLTACADRLPLTLTMHRARLAGPPRRQAVFPFDLVCLDRTASGVRPAAWGAREACVRRR